MILAKTTLAAGYILARLLSCEAEPPPQVNLDFQNTSAVWLTDKSSQDLGRFHPSTTFSHGPNEIFMTGGLTESNISTGFKFNFRTLADPQTGATCVWPTDILITVGYAPRVFVASGFKPGSCRYKTTAEHELRHVNTDLITLSEYLPRVKAAVGDAAGAVGVQGPVSGAALGRAEELYTSVIRTELDKQMTEMDRVRMMRQQQIDTRAEYLRQTTVCPGEPVHIDR